MPFISSKVIRGNKTPLFDDTTSSNAEESDVMAPMLMLTCAKTLLPAINRRKRI
jgi:hypothetical protein